MAVGLAVTLLMVQWSALTVLMNTLYKAVNLSTVTVATGVIPFHSASFSMKPHLLLRHNQHLRLHQALVFFSS